MTVPSNSELNMYDGTPFDQTDWDSNFNQIITWLTSGNYEMTFNTVNATTYTGLPTNAFTLVAGEDLTAGDILRESGGQAYKASNATSSGITKVIGVAAATTSAAGTVTINYDYFSSFSGLTVGTKYYVGVDGAITSTKPQDYPFEVGLAVSTTRINFNFEEDSAPVGTIISTPLTSVPKGYLECNGSAVSRTTHALLFGELGVFYGNGDGSTTFNLPDYRGQFLRGFDNGSGTDPDAASRTDRGDGTTGDAVGTKQTDEIKSHTHDGNRAGSGIIGNNSGRIPRMNNEATPSTSTIAEATGGNETRPKNIYVMYCIKL